MSIVVQNYSYLKTSSLFGKITNGESYDTAKIIQKIKEVFK